MQQCREGWHLAEDPLGDEQCDRDADAENDSSRSNLFPRRVRSTRRRSDFPALPRLPAEHRSVGRTFVTATGRSYRPSMFVTLTVPSFGRVVSGVGCPANADEYDYRRAAVYALGFSRLFDRWMQNLRRCAGFRVQYFGAIEGQKRLAPHIHLAIRGAIPRRVLKAVTAATYVQLWWPPIDEPVYVREVPVWDDSAHCYRDPLDGIALPTWDEVVDSLESPAATLRSASDGHPGHRGRARRRRSTCQPT